MPPTDDDEAAEGAGPAPPEAKAKRKRKTNESAAEATPASPARGAPRQLAVPRGLFVILLSALATLVGVLQFTLGSGASAGAWCLDGDECRSGICMAARGSGTCADRCEVDDDCPADRVCRFVGHERVCWRAAHVAVGERCDSESDCIEGTCVSIMRPGGDLSGRCAVHCRSGLCDEGFVCTDERCLRPEFIGLPPPRHPRAHDAGPEHTR